LLQASDYINTLEEKVYNANKTSLELLKQLKEADEEIGQLKAHVIELRQRMSIYIPFTDDDIDVRLAEFINNYPERQKMKIMFLRESQGVYQFGSRRVAVNVMKDKINSKNNKYLHLQFVLVVDTCQSTSSWTNTPPKNWKS